MKRKFNLAKVLPLWAPTHSTTANLAFLSLLSSLGITDVATYFRKLSGLIAVCVVVCACIGASNYDLTGFIFGALLGLIAPAALLWVGVMLIGIAIYLGVFCAAWVVVYYIGCWFLSAMFGA